MCQVVWWASFGELKVHASAANGHGGSSTLLQCQPPQGNGEIKLSFILCSIGRKLISRFKDTPNCDKLITSHVVRSLGKQRLCYPILVINIHTWAKN